MRLTKFNVVRRPGERITSGSAKRRVLDKKTAMAVKADCRRMAEEKKELLQKEIEQQKQLALGEMCASEPWGRPGCGAPNPETMRRRDLRIFSIYPEDEIKKTARTSRSMSPRPIRRASRHRTKEAPQIRFQIEEDSRKAVKNHLRYRMPADEKIAYKKQLDELVETKKERIQEEMAKEREWARKWRVQKEPWGKAGPGGVPWRDPRGIGRNFFESMGWTDNKVLRELKLGNIPRKRSVTLPPLAIKNHSRNIGVKKPDTELQLLEKSNHNEQDAADQTVNKDIKETEDNILVDEPSIDQQQKEEITPEDFLLQNTGGVELMPLIARRRYFGPKPLPSSDVTKPPSIDIRWRENSVDYLQELVKQMSVKRIQAEKTKKLSAEDYRRHCETCLKMWGRPGNGAPVPGQIHRNNLGRILNIPLGVH